jgi:hypothetical protein
MAVMSRAGCNQPASDPVRPEDLAATLFGMLGIDPRAEINDMLDRPLPAATGQQLGAPGLNRDRRLYHLFRGPP